MPNLGSQQNAYLGRGQIWGHDPDQVLKRTTKYLSAPKFTTTRILLGLIHFLLLSLLSLKFTFLNEDYAPVVAMAQTICLYAYTLTRT